MLNRAAAERGLSVRACAVLWAGSVFVALAILSAGWLIGRDKMSEMQERILTDATALDAGRLLELAILSERREDLLWRATGDENHSIQGDVESRAVHELPPRLEAYATSAQERAIVGEIAAKLKRLDQFRAGHDKAKLETEIVLVEGLLAAVGSYQAQNKAQMSETADAARELRGAMTKWLMALLLVVGLILLAGTVGILRRIIRPALALTRAADKVGKGNFEVPAIPMRNDEMGRLTRTFNNMVEDIAKREEHRLRFVATVAHDLRNPIVGIALAARLLRSGARLEGDAKRWLDMIANDAARLDAMAKALMDNVQVSAGNLSLHRERLELTGLMRRVTGDCAVAHGGYDLVFTGDDECPVQGDPDKLERVALNRVSNAVKYSPKGTAVRVSVRQEGANAVLAVVDGGPGISKEDTEVIFQPFGRGEGAHIIAKGTGLGLFVVKQIVDAHGGQIDVESTPGSGTTVRIALPLLAD
jgi:two-component system sensor histidine kinase MtrB